MVNLRLRPSLLQAFHGDCLTVEVVER